MSEMSMTLPIVTTWDGSVIPATISGVTAHTWTADASGLFTTSANLHAEWTADYSAMLEGHANLLSPLQRMEGNAEAVIENTHAATMSAPRQDGLRMDLQREFDAIDAAMRIDQAKYGIDPTQQFNTYTYLKMEETLQSSEPLQELGYQGHGTNDPIAAKYDGFTTTYQNKTDNQTYYVGGGIGNGEKAIASFLDDDVLTHAPFPTVMHNGALTQLNQNGNLENSLTDAVAAANATTYTRVFVASDFSTDKAAHGIVDLVPGAKAAPMLPVAAAGEVTTLDGSVIAGTITGLTPHSWIADSTGLFHTTANLAAEWAADYRLMQQGAPLTPLQRWEANAEAVLQNTGVAKLSATREDAFRQDTQREIDSVWAAMQIDQTTMGISATAEFTDHTYLMMERTLRFDEPLEELAIQGHGLNGDVLAKYRGFTENFQNRTDGKTLYVGPGTDHGEKAIADFFDDVVMTHAPFPTVLHNGKLEQLNQNGTAEDTLHTAAAIANDVMFDLSLNATDFTHPVTPPAPVPVKKA